MGWSSVRAAMAKDLFKNLNVKGVQSAEPLGSSKRNQKKRRITPALRLELFPRLCRLAMYAGVIKPTRK